MFLILAHSVVSVNACQVNEWIFVFLRLHLRIPDLGHLCLGCILVPAWGGAECWQFEWFALTVYRCAANGCWEVEICLLFCPEVCLINPLPSCNITVLAAMCCPHCGAHNCGCNVDRCSLWRRMLRPNGLVYAWMVIAANEAEENGDNVQ